MMAWTTPATAVANSALTAATWNATVRDNLNETAPAKATTAGRWFIATGANAIAERAIVGATVTTNQNTATTTYTDLTTPGPAVTATTGTKAIVFLAAQIANSTGGAIALMSFAVSGATTRSPADGDSIHFTSSAASDQARIGAPQLIEGLTAGSNTFTAKYRAASGTGFWTYRHIAVMAL